MDTKHSKRIAVLCLSAILSLSAAVLPALPVSLEVSAATSTSSTQNTTVNFALTGVTKNADNSVSVSVRLPKSTDKQYFLYRLQHKSTGEVQWKRIHTFTTNGKTRNFKYTDKNPVNTVTSGSAEYVYGLKEAGTNTVYKFFSQPLSISMQYDKNTGNITVKWKKKNSTSTKYQVFYRGVDNCDVIVDTTADSKLTIKNAVPQGTKEKKYTYYVRCVSDVNSKVVQSPVAVKSGTYSRSSVITGVTAYNDSIGVCFKWNTFKNADRYRVEKKVKDQWKVIGTTYRTIFTDADVTRDSASYRIYAIDSKGNRLTDYYNITHAYKSVSMDAMIKGKTIRISGGDQTAPGNNGVAKARLYSDQNATKEIAQLNNDTKAIVTDVYYVAGQPAKSRFKVKVNGKEGWVKMNYCLVRVQDAVPSINVALSYASATPFTNSNKTNLYELDHLNMFHYQNNSTVIKGLADKALYQTNEAWLRYDTLHKLAEAQRKFLRQGYCIKLYDAFRPIEVTRSTDKDWDTYIYNYISKTDPTHLTYQIANYSIHNWGGAVDMTLTKLSDGMEIKAQTYMHDLSYNSKTANNNGDAQMMQKIMKSCNFGVYSGEWWHFQDNVGTVNQVFYKNVAL